MQSVGKSLASSYISQVKIKQDPLGAAEQKGPSMAIQKTYTMIKPDGVRNGHIGEIVNRFERAGLSIERMELGMVTLEQAKANYAEHEGKPFYEDLVAYITSGPGH